MSKRIFLLAAVLVALSLSNGCFTLFDDDWTPSPFNDHNVRLFNAMLSDLNEAHRDFDIIVFGLDEEDD